jgi:hypothetical protein
MIFASDFSVVYGGLRDTLVALRIMYRLMLRVLTKCGVYSYCFLSKKAGLMLGAAFGVYATQVFISGTVVEYRF